MDNIPPSYESAVARNPWRIISSYIPSAELCALNRVSRELHQVFAPCLWGNPASHFGTENYRVYGGLVWATERKLKRVRLSVRQLTHTLHLPPAQSELYDEPHPEWLRDVLEQLPNLQSLIVSRLPFFDHMALLTLRDYGNGRRPSPDGASPTFALRLLIAACCQNTTSQGLAEALSHFPSLAFLDLSNTLAARDRSVLSSLRDLPLLQVLKLRNVHLRDEDIMILAGAIGTRVRSLDVQGNHLTDNGVRTLLNSCLEDGYRSNGLPEGRPRFSSNLFIEDWPAGLVRPDPAVLDEFKDEKYDERLVRRLTSGMVSRLPSEDLPYSGITHLHIAENNLTVDGVAALVMSKKLHVLDAGTVNTGKPLNQSRSETSPSRAECDARRIKLPGVEKLTPVLGKCAQSMTSLRLHHAIITENTPLKQENPTVAIGELVNEAAKNELEATLPTEPDAAVWEMDATPPLYELGDGDPRPHFELAGDSTHFTLTPPMGDKPTLSKEESQAEARRGSVFASEVVRGPVYEDDSVPGLTATSLGTTAQAVNGISSPEHFKTTNMPGCPPSTGRGNTEVQLSLIVRQRKELRSSRLEKPHGLIPGMLPKLRRITLTDVPCYEKSRHVVDALIQFIEDCASEAELATLQAQLEPSSQRKPGERRSKHDRDRAREIFALQHIILEMAATKPSAVANKTPTSNSTKRTKSSTEDADSEALWSAAEHDFTFFDDDEECGLPSVDTDSSISSSSISEKTTVPIPPINQLPTLRRATPTEPLIDVVQELAKFRKERKATYEEAGKGGVQQVNGYWPGEVKVVRGHHAGENTDYYGNHFGKGGVYR